MSTPYIPIYPSADSADFAVLISTLTFLIFFYNK